MSEIRVNKLSFAYEGSYDMVFEDVSFQIDTNWRLGLIGRNGRGKTTLLRLLMGEYAYEGSISSSVSFSYFPYRVNERQESVLEVIKAQTKQAEDWEITRELSLLGFSQEIEQRRFETLSAGEQTKVLLAALFLGQARFLLIDEPTDHLDLAGREVVAQYLRQKSGFILVSHDRSFLDCCVSHILSINKSDISLHRGNASSWQENQARTEQFESRVRDQLQKDAKKCSAAARSSAAWSQETEASKHGSRNSGLRPDRGYLGHKAAKMMKRAKQLERRQQQALEEAQTLLRNAERADALKLHPLEYHSKRLLSVQDLSICYAGQKASKAQNFALFRGERLALCGGNGAGKTSILRLLCGESVPHTGYVQCGSGLLLSYVPQTAQMLFGSLRDFARARKLDETLLLSILRKLDFPRVQFEKDLDTYSAGQKKKLLLAASLCQSAHLYIWDEPLNYMDMLSRVQIEELILAHQPSMIFVEHDQSFTARIATRRLLL